jgi:ESCRT-II complex subunit VPS36
MFLGRLASVSLWFCLLPYSVFDARIGGIMQSVETSAQATSDSLDSALKDLETLMLKAKDMVRLASELNERLTSKGADSEPEEATFIRNSLSQLGLHMPNAPVTQDMLLDESNWIEELAKELAAILQGSASSSPYDRRDNSNTGLMKQRGIIALDEVWGGWNRARGVGEIPL